MCLSQSVKESLRGVYNSPIYLSAINLTPINYPFLIVYLSSFQHSQNTAQSVQRFSGDELEAWFKPEEI